MTIINSLEVSHSYRHAHQYASKVGGRGEGEGGGGKEEELFHTYVQNKSRILSWEVGVGVISYMFTE